MLPLFEKLFSLFQPDVFELLQSGGRDDDGELITGAEWFDSAISLAFADIAREHDCRITLSDIRIREARFDWLHDCDRIRVNGSDNPDHFKRAGYLCFWLRRRVLIEAIVSMEDAPLSDFQAFFHQFGNEICSFMVCFRICFFFECRRALAVGEIPDKDFLSVDLPQGYIDDVSKLLRFNHVSPHSLYLIYKALFTNIVVPKPKATLRAIGGRAL